MKNNEMACLREIVIDSCQMSDEVLAEILAGAAAQIQPAYSINKFIKPKRQFLWSFVYTNNQFGPKSFEQL